MSLGAPEILVILVIALLVFGPTRLPEVGRQIGRGIREIRKFQTSIRDEFEDVLVEDVSDTSGPAPKLPPVHAPPDGTEGVPTVDAPGGEAPGAPAAPADQAIPPAPPNPS